MFFLGSSFGLRQLDNEAQFWVTQTLDDGCYLQSAAGFDYERFHRKSIE
jgi:hypothetical protein